MSSRTHLSSWNRCTKRSLPTRRGLCEANIAALFLYDGEVLTTAASYGTTQEFAEHLEAEPTKPKS